MTTELPELGPSAARAMRRHHVKVVEDLEGWTWQEIEELDGIGPNAVDILREAARAARVQLREKPTA